MSDEEKNRLSYYFASLCTWRYHPGYYRGDFDGLPPSLDECMELALEMMGRYAREVRRASSSE